MRACVRACVCACVHACVCVNLNNLVVSFKFLLLGHEQEVGNVPLIEQNVGNIPLIEQDIKVSKFTLLEIRIRK